ncbi:hypothetical protein ACEWY4_001269 [Coilia grayii]|uniref:C2H2-type domain-containing protein n=1 Tax=Coilia grayii TaxID=363190 RepID=A0ABD1KZI4_9TELE
MDLKKSHECEVCNKRFTEKSNLTRHMKLHYPNEHACDVCGKSFSSTPQLNLNEQMKSQKEFLLEYVKDFHSVTCLVEKKLKEKKVASWSSISQYDFNYASNVELLAVAGQLLDESEVSVSTQITTLGQLTPAAIT